MAEMTDKKVKKNWKVMKVSLEKVAAILYESKKILVDVMVIVKICDHDDMLTRPSSMTKALQPETSVEKIFRNWKDSDSRCSGKLHHQFTELHLCPAHLHADLKCSWMNISSFPRLTLLFAEVENFVQEQSTRVINCRSIKRCGSRMFRRIPLKKGIAHLVFSQNYRYIYYVTLYGKYK
ncbi:uncharacterized protein [Argopecten irradians]|uniref:uncharacterized protein isoform X1 n=1 Tax=Argopecten irradians TaxID=31199 RepID=UPI003718542B